MNMQWHTKCVPALKDCVDDPGCPQDHVLNHNKRVTIESWITIVGYDRITRFWFWFLVFSNTQPCTGFFATHNIT